MRAGSQSDRRVVEALPKGLASGPTGLEVWTARIGEATRWPEHRHVEHELLVVTAGTFTLEISGKLWLVPPTLGVWIPSSVPHRATADPGTTYACVYIRPECSTLQWSQPTIFSTSAMLMATIEYLDRDDLSLPARQRAESVLYDLLQPVEMGGIELPLPDDERALDVARALIDHPADARSLEDWGLVVGASPRTLQRLFSVQTGMGFERWRTQARVRWAFVQLAQGASVAEVSRSLGYRSTSAFVARFGRTTGITPGEYAARCRGVVATSFVG